MVRVANKRLKDISFVVGLPAIVLAVVLLARYIVTANRPAEGERIAAKNLFETRHLLEEELTDTARIKERLSEYGVSAKQIDALDDTKDISIQLPVIAPRDGVIVSRQAVEGAPVTTATPLFAI